MLQLLLAMLLLAQQHESFAGVEQKLVDERARILFYKCRPSHSDTQH